MVKDGSSDPDKQEHVDFSNLYKEDISSTDHINKNEIKDKMRSRQAQNHLSLDHPPIIAENITTEDDLIVYEEICQVRPGSPTIKWQLSPETNKRLRLISVKCPICGKVYDNRNNVVKKLPSVYYKQYTI